MFVDICNNKLKGSALTNRLAVTRHNVFIMAIACRQVFGNACLGKISKHEMNM